MVRPELHNKLDIPLYSGELAYVESYMRVENVMFIFTCCITSTSDPSLVSWVQYWYLGVISQEHWESFPANEATQGQRSSSAHSSRC